MLAECSGTTGLRLWLVPAGGGAPTPLGSAVATPSDYGIPTGAWSLNGTVYLNKTAGSGCPQAPWGPDGSGIFRAAAGRSSPVSLPGAVGGDSRVLGTSGDRLLVLARTSCPGTAALLWFNPAAGTVQPLLAAWAGTAGVVSALPF